jgi:hypothetical protein
MSNVYCVVVMFCGPEAEVWAAPGTARLCGSGLRSRVGPSPKDELNAIPVLLTCLHSAPCISSAEAALSTTGHLNVMVLPSRAGLTQRVVRWVGEKHGLMNRQLLAFCLMCRRLRSRLTKPRV